MREGQAIKSGQAGTTPALSSAVRNDQRAKSKMITSHNWPANENRPFEHVCLNAARRPRTWMTASRIRALVDVLRSLAPDWPSDGWTRPGNMYLG